MKRPPVILVLAAVAVSAGAAADETKIHMKDGAETTALVADCSVCHSLDYVQMNSRFLKRAGWEAEVKKMVSVMGAPTNEADAAKLVDYLTREYGVTE
jgi:hypothetical protein